MNLLELRVADKNLILNRKEMNQISGGADHGCSVTNVGGIAEEYACDEPDYCQGYADWMCEHDNSCIDVNCV